MVQEGINSAQKAVEELTRKLQDLAWDVQQERVNARVIMESLFLEDIHIKRLATLPVSPHPSSVPPTPRALAVPNGDANLAKTAAYSLRGWVWDPDCHVGRRCARRSKRQ